ncbi:MAG: hypothetical protein HY922_03350 [Elusimicrobia bacterium]|nr:hypothetical protein [Elusimicrobiota bacterium]
MIKKPLGPIFVTYSSKNKKRKAGRMRAIERYDSPRIRQIAAAAASLGIGFRILSGKYGLLAPDDRISCYDHLLKWEGIGRVLARVSKRLARERVAAVIYFTRPLRKASAPLAYHALIEAACAEQGIRMVAVEVERPAARGTARLEVADSLERPAQGRGF